MIGGIRYYESRSQIKTWTIIDETYKILLSQYLTFLHLYSFPIAYSILK